eukprot:6330826-Prymnesium_polylepis.1
MGTWRSREHVAWARKDSMPGMRKDTSRFTSRASRQTGDSGLSAASQVTLTIARISSGVVQP